MRELKFWQVDAFTQEPFKGNPAAVFILEKELDDDLMQLIAIEMNLSETAFILLRENKKPLLRWFTPMYEIDLCGHATIASSEVYFSHVDRDTDKVVFDTKYVGPIEVNKCDQAYTMSFPLREGEEVNVNSIPKYILDSLSSSKPIYAAKSRDLMLVYDNEDSILEMKPDFNKLSECDEFIIVTAKSSNSKYDFISRFFCAAEGISEDPVTGSAHSTLAPYWAKQLNKTNMLAYQASKRGGELRLEMKADHVNITGYAVKLIEGCMSL